MLTGAKENFINSKGHAISYWNQYPMILCDVSS